MEPNEKRNLLIGIFWGLIFSFVAYAIIVIVVKLIINQ